MKLAPALATAAMLATSAAAQPLSIVAAENFYGDVARQVAGPDAAITSIMSNPDEDPHLFEASPSVARSLVAADVVIYNGADYDPWMTKLLGATRAPKRKVIVVANLVHRKTGDNPHLWYDPKTMPAVAKTIAAAMTERDPSHKAEYDQRLATFLSAQQPVDAKVSELHNKYAGTPVTATEPVFGYMATALGFKMRNERFQLAVMNNTEPRVSDVVAFESDLRQHRVRLLFYNSQASDAAAQRMVRIAQQAKIPVVGVTETEPAGKTYQSWMLDQLDAVERALGGGTS
jgi:zinc/manganese transport system substrate-binding protein